MERAINLAKSRYKEGGHAVAAIVVNDKGIVAEAFTTIQRDLDPTAHAEINAIREAAKILNSRSLEGCYLYTTYEPCPMCTSAAIWAKMQGIVYGANRDDQTKGYSRHVYIPAADVIKSGTPKLELYPDFMRKECKALLKLN